VLQTIPEQGETMRSAFDGTSRDEDDVDSPTDPMIPVILASHSPAPANADSIVEPTTPRGAVQASSGLYARPATPDVQSTGVPAQPRRSTVPTVVGICFVAAQVLLLFRVVLLLFNVSNSFAWAKVLYAAGGVFALPFRLLFDHIQLLSQLGPGVSNYLAPLAAILIYGLISRILVRFLKALLNS
jgi:hypothetical protein